MMIYLPTISEIDSNIQIVTDNAIGHGWMKKIETDRLLHQLCKEENRSYRRTEMKKGRKKVDHGTDHFDLNGAHTRKKTSHTKGGPMPRSSSSATITNLTSSNRGKTKKGHRRRNSDPGAFEGRKMIPAYSISAVEDRRNHQPYFCRWQNPVEKTTHSSLPSRFPMRQDVNRNILNESKEEESEGDEYSEISSFSASFSSASSSSSSCSSTTSSSTEKETQFQQIRFDTSPRRPMRSITPERLASVHDRTTDPMGSNDNGQATSNDSHRCDRMKCSVHLVDDSPALQDMQLGSNGIFPTHDGKSNSSNTHKRSASYDQHRSFAFA